MSGSEVLEEAFGRIPDAVAQAVDGLDAGQLAYRPTLADGSGAPGNSVAWLIWHLSRVQDNHLADAADRDELWLSEGWAEKFNLALPREDTGYGHASDDVDKVRVEAGQQLVEYHSAVHARSMEFIRALNEMDLNRIIDASWDPPVTMRVRLVSVVEDCLQHAGQAAYLRGLLI
ncbi:DinB family protein [Arthrobacter tecti]